MVEYEEPLTGLGFCFVKCEAKGIELADLIAR